jgi:hypothetical protein
MFEFDFPTATGAPTPTQSGAIGSLIAVMVLCCEPLAIALTAAAQGNTGFLGRRAQSSTRQNIPILVAVSQRGTNLAVPR